MWRWRWWQVLLCVGLRLCRLLVGRCWGGGLVSRNCCELPSVSCLLLSGVVLLDLWLVLELRLLVLLLLLSELLGLLLELLPKLLCQLPFCLMLRCNVCCLL